jgi:acyl-coenzyme A thioesterase PaaI-like protein
MRKAGKTLFYADAEVRTDDDRLIAHGSSTLMRMKGQGLALPMPMFA